MELNVQIGNNSLLIPIQNPFSLDMDSLVQQIENFAFSEGAVLTGLNIKDLISKMVKGIAGCEHGCPADAKTLILKGLKGFELEYIEGGILSARAKTTSGSAIYLKMFPEF